MNCVYKAAPQLVAKFNVSNKLQDSVESLVLMRP